jgi:hypothetical protein
VQSFFELNMSAARLFIQAEAKSLKDLQSRAALACQANTSVHDALVEAHCISRAAGAGPPADGQHEA